jgi:hypothetical protein
MRRIKAKKELAKDMALVFLGAIIAFTLSNLGFIALIIDFIGNEILVSFFSGIFFTSIFTIAPASIALVDVSGISIMEVSFWGALGALCGDLILFFFIRDRFAKNVMASMRPSVLRQILKTFHFGFMKWLAPVIGALIIASPLPDEFGLALLGFSKTKLSLLVPMAFVMNFVGIYSLLWFVSVV